MQYISVYGFDYDYTLANYTDELPKMIYTMIRDSLIARGLHYDVLTGWLMKVDAYHNIQINTVHYGREALRNFGQILDLHNGTHLSPSYMRDNLIQLNDLFSVPEICLIADIIQYFYEHNVPFHPRHLYDDVRTMGELIHLQASHHPLGVGPLHLEILSDVERYLNPSPPITSYLEGLRLNGKKTFLLTNSGSRGLSYVLGTSNWRELFDVTIVKAAKPSFYTSGKPFRRVVPEKGANLKLGWKSGVVLQEGIRLDMGSVLDFKQGEVYQGGNLHDFSRFTGWRGQKVLYIGDHIYSDLADATVQQGWRTGAIVSELDGEIARSNAPKARAQLSWMLHLEQLLRIASSGLNPHDRETLDSLVNSWRNERRQLRNQLKQVHNHQFGSVFRTHHNPTYFAKKIRTFADLYTSKLENLANYPLNFVFYPERSHLPHEKSVALPELFIQVNT
ncbi:hypothetical protein L0F63_005418 [Massospora cicadina]|nr:hypothetical protein L0F63_005418 [Massospora cicadina]